jgi:hypothetical protein
VWKYEGLLISCLAFVLVAATGQPGQPSGDAEVLQRRVAIGDLGKFPPITALMIALNNAKVPGGIVKIKSCQEQQKKNMSSTGSSMRNVLDAFVMADPQYKWQIEDGVVNLVPATGDPPLLDVRIPEFKVENVETLDDAASRLLATPSVKKGITALGLEQGVQRLSGPGYYLPPDSRKEDSTHKLTVTGKNLSLREALNTIVRVRGSGVWLYTENHCRGRKEFSVKFPSQGDMR